MEKIMLAFFRSTQERDNAVSEAKKEGIQMLYVGAATTVIDGYPADHSPEPFVLFRAYSGTDAIFFMRHGAGSCGVV